jgi:hypothetical protein
LDASTASEGWYDNEGVQHQTGMVLQRGRSHCHRGSKPRSLQRSSVCNTVHRDLSRSVRAPEHARTRTYTHTHTRTHTTPHTQRHTQTHTDTRTHHTHLQFSVDAPLRTVGRAHFGSAASDVVRREVRAVEEQQVQVVEAKLVQVAEHLPPPDHHRHVPW